MVLWMESSGFVLCVALILLLFGFLLQAVRDTNQDSSGTRKPIRDFFGC